MSDKVIIIIFYVIVAINAVFIWMRMVLKQKGQKYSYTDFSWSVYYSYLAQMSQDKKLKSKLVKFILLDSFVLIVISALTILW